MSEHVREVREAVRKAYLAGLVDIGGYRNGQPLYRASHRRFRIVTALSRRLHLIACKDSGSAPLTSTLKMDHP